jgi:histidyl-tRNA synthetase
MNDILPAATPRWQHLEAIVRHLLADYGYREIRLPLTEFTALFQRGIGDVTDIVEKEMYTFTDRSGDSLSLRPEGTAGCVRAVLEHGLIAQQQTQRLWYQGAMFRHERPQKGRYRQFHQIGAEAFGFPGPEIDAEMLTLTARLWRRLGIEGVRLQVNTLGTTECRAAWRDRLVAYFSTHAEQLDDDSQRRLHSNPLRILDSKNPAMQGLIADAPRLLDHLDDVSMRHFDRLREMLEVAGVVYEINPRLVRGLDYYTHTVFEWVTNRLGAQGTVCAGGRYDGLVEQLGGPATPAFGFALGLERIIELLPDQTTTQAPAAYVVTGSPAAWVQALALCERLRDAVPGLPLILHAAGGGFKLQFKHADRSGAAIALVLGDDELAQGSIGIKFLRAPETAQIRLPQAELADWLAAWQRGQPLQ